MKTSTKKLLSLLLVFVLVLGMFPVKAQAATADNYELRVLDFEGEYWDALIDDPQYGGELLYGEGGMGFSSEEEAYQWTDEDTQLQHVLPYNWGTYCYMGGGHAVSNYATENYTAYGNSDSQLTVYDAEAGDEIAREGGGHNGSDNFAVHFGYMDGSDYNQTAELPALSFADGEARVVDHMYVNMTVYTMNCLLNGNDLTASGGTFYVKAIGFNGEEQTGEVTMPLSDGESPMVTDWVKWDLSGLGEVTAILFNVGGSADNGYGFSQPAYFAYDDVAVRFPVEAEPPQQSFDALAIAFTSDNERAKVADMTSEGDTGKVYWILVPESRKNDKIILVSGETPYFSIANPGMSQPQSLSGLSYDASVKLIDRQYNYNAADKLIIKSQEAWDAEFGSSDKPVCEHTETTTAYAQVEGTETHTITVTCANEACGEQISEVTTANCVDADSNGECDLCKGIVLDLPKLTAPIVEAGVWYVPEPTHNSIAAEVDLDWDNADRAEWMAMDSSATCKMVVEISKTEDFAEVAATQERAIGVILSAENRTFEFYGLEAGTDYYVRAKIAYLDGFLDSDYSAVVKVSTLEATCQHTETTTVYAQVEGTKTHTVTVTCANAECRQQIGESTTADCVDEDKNNKCDLCSALLASTSGSDRVSIAYATSNGSFDSVNFMDADGNPLECADIAYNAANKTIDVTLPADVALDAKVKAAFNLTQNGDGLPFLTTKTGTSGTASGKAVNNKFTAKDFTLSGGAANFTFYLYNTTPKTTNNKYETWTLSFKITNNLPTFAENVNETVTGEVYADSSYEADISGIFTDGDGDALTYQVRVGNGSWTNMEGTTYSYTSQVAGEYVLQFRAYDGKDYSVDIYTVNLTVHNSTTTYDVHVTAPEGYAVKYYIVSEISGGSATAGAELVPENGVLKVPGNVDTIVWTCDNAVCGTAKVSESAEVAIKAVNFSGKTITDIVDEAGSVKVTDPNGVVMTVSANGTALLAAGSGYTFAATSGISGWNGVTLTDQTVSADTTVEIEYMINGEKTVTAPKDAAVTVYYQAGNYKGVTQTPVYTTENEDGTVTYHYSCTGKVGNTTASGYVYRATMDGKITKAGYLNAVNDVTLSWSEQDKAPSYRGADESPNYTTTDGATQRRAGDNVLMTVNSTGHLVLSETKDVGVFRNWAIINTDTENVVIEPDYHFNVVNGDDVVTFTDLGSGYGNNWQRLSKNGSGTAFVEVSFDAIHIVDGYEAGGWGGAYGHMSNYTYNASNPDTTGMIVVQTDGNAASDVAFNIASDRKAFSRQWDAEVDTYYILEDTGLLTLSPTASSGIRSVSVSNDKGATWTILEESEGAYVATVVPGNNIIRVINANGETAYQVVRALKLDLKIENLTDPSKGEEFAPGETVRLYVTGLISPIGKMGGIYNPQSVQGSFAGSDDNNYSLTGPGGVTGSYAFNGKTYYIDNIVIPESGQLTLSGKYLAQNGFNLQLGKHRGITMAGTGGAAGGAEGSSGASVLPVIVLGEEESAEPEIIYGDVDSDGYINATDATLVLRHAASLKVMSFNAEAADVNGDGYINATDATLILRYAASLITSFPIEENE